MYEIFNIFIGTFVDKGRCEIVASLSIQHKVVPGFLVY